jgi:D-alanine--poly(phosphoribitol) ligase subunit 2
VQGLPERIDAIIRDALSVDVPSHDTDLIETGLLDSLALVSLLAELEQALGVELPLDELEVDDFRSVDRIAVFLVSSGVCSPNGRV